jgi:hypothetical protein
VIKYLIYILLFPVGLIAQNISFATVGVQDMSGIEVEVEHLLPGATTGTISSLTSGIPADRGRGTSTIFSSNSSDQGSVTVNFPAGYKFTIGSTDYTSGKLHANAWMAFPTTNYNSYASSATAPNVPTLHFTSVNNGYTDNNMSHVSTETYNDASLGDVFRIRYEGSYAYNVSGINTKIDLYFVKNNPKDVIVVLRTFLADGSNIEQIGLSNGSAWLASNMISNATYANGRAFIINTAVSTAGYTSAGIQTTTSSGTLSFSNPNNYSYRVNVDVSKMQSYIGVNEMNYLMYMRMFPNEMKSWDFHTCEFNGDMIVGYEDVKEIWRHYDSGDPITENAVYSQSEKDDIEVNALTFKYHEKYPRSAIRTFEDLNRFYIVSLGKHRQTINAKEITQ